MRGFTRVDMSRQESIGKGFAEFMKGFDGNYDICVLYAGINRNLSLLGIKGVMRAMAPAMAAELAKYATVPH
jgi:hypothetical protein